MAETNQELTQQFHTRFQAGTSELYGRLESLRNGTASPQDVESVAAEVAKIRKDLTDAITFLPGYDQRQCDNKLKDIEAQIEALRSATAPKSKFAFKRKAKPVASPTPSTSSPSEGIAISTPQSTSRTAPDGSSSATQTSGLRLSGHSHSYLTVSSLSTPWSAASDLTISDLDHCIVNLIPSPANPDVPADLTFTALHVRNITNSVLVLPIITGSALLHDMKNCVIALGSRQFRMHTSSRVDVYISIASNPIIEHCSEIRFADYASSLRPTSLADTQDVKSNYLAVQDFTHIRATPSPNWSPLPFEQQIADGAWPLSTGSAPEMLRALLPAQGS
ncbi:tubulin binding cofactor C-domain-containing protein [Cubamyces menziesii]|uniref:C-CAP/cofactor C-like domain-containing protein n=1 Tax=Trametes cubensis TaxID=1111947 RepID=A0AAD7TU49_9APHY|nr:tubulin binding cofactor C-domain-containing protein [Cubamyces menziesii]KAJ8482092.1 hypothetical protein ONZ51_g5572 [Trametes cubensis]